MARIERASPEVKAPVKQAVLIDPNAFKFTGAGEGLKAIGEVLTELGERKKKAKDSIGISDSNSIIKNTEIDMETELQNTPFKDRPKIRQKWSNASITRINELDMSQGEKNRAIQGSRVAWETIINLGELSDTEAIVKESQVKAGDKWGEALVNAQGNPEDINVGIAEEALDKTLTNMGPADAKSFKEEIIKVSVRQMHDNAKSEVRELAAGSPLVAIERIEGEQSIRIKGEPKDFSLVSNEDLLSAKNLAKSTLVSNSNKIQREFDLAVGAAATEISEGIKNKTITENDIWQMEITVPIGKEKDLELWRESRASTVRGIEDRTRKQQDGVEKKKREDAYNPQVVASLKTQARGAVTPTEVSKVKELAQDAFSKDEIDDNDIESISISADATFKTVFDKTIDEAEKQLSDIMLRGTSSESLAPWIQSQVVRISATGRAVTSEEISDLIQTFQDVGKAKQWSINEARREVDEEVASTEKQESVKEGRILFLESQKKWLRKTDTELVEEYKAWLTQKP